MSLLLDAVTRHRHGEALQQGLELAMLAALPPSRSTRRFRGIWLAPFLGGALGAGLAAALGAPPQAPIPSLSPQGVPAIMLAQRVAMPPPVQLPSSDKEEAMAGEVALAGLPVTLVPPAERIGRPAQGETQRSTDTVPATEPAQKPAPELVQAFEAALADLGESLPSGDIGEPLPVTEGAGTMEVDPEAASSAEPPPLSPDLQRRLAQVQREIAQAKGQPQPPAPMPDNRSVPKLGQMPWAFQKRLPDLTVTAHVYATKPADRWLRANGRELQEGDEAANGLTVVEILPSEIVLEMDQQRFRIPALGSL